jgi:SAM-dependent methyltransferase
VTTRWSGTEAPRGDDYDARFDRLAASGVDVHGEAACVERLLAARGISRGRILDAGCGTGRVAIELARRGHAVVGVDLDPSMLDAARRKAPELDWRTADMSDLHLEARFDAAVLAGNVMIFVAAGSEARVLERVAAHLAAGGLVIAGFQLGRGLDLIDYDEAADATGLQAVAAYSTWDGAPFVDGGDYVVRVHEKT